MGRPRLAGFSLFHVERLWRQLISKTGAACTEGQIAMLTRYRDWLADEARVGGGIGPKEVDRLDWRHIGDSLLYLSAMPESDEVLDVGSGAGLPGIPLAVARPDTLFVLLDRSRRRVELLRRAVRVLDVGNIEVIHGDFEDWNRTVPVVVSRAAIPPEKMRPGLTRVLSPGGTAIIGGSWAASPSVDGYQTIEIGTENLDQPVWILMMRQT